MNRISRLVDRIVEDDRLSHIVMLHEISLAEKCCTDRSLGKWIDEFGLEPLRVVMPMSDADVEAVLPNLSLSLNERVDLLQCLENHTSVCGHCKMKVKFDAELDGAISVGSDEISGEEKVSVYYEATGA